MDGRTLFTREMEQLKNNLELTLDSVNRYLKEDTNKYECCSDISDLKEGIASVERWWGLKINNKDNEE